MGLRTMTCACFSFLWAVLSAVLLIMQVKPACADLLVSANTYGSILRYDERTGAYLGTFVTAYSGGLQTPTGIVCGPDGNLYVADLNAGVLRFNGQTGDFIDVFVPHNLAWYDQFLIFGPDGNLYVTVECLPKTGPPDVLDSFLKTEEFHEARTVFAGACHTTQPPK